MQDEPPHLIADPQLETFLRELAARPSAGFEAELERRLFEAPAARRSWRPVGFGALVGAAGGLTVVLLAAGLIGGGPLAPRGGDDATATPGCETVYVTRMQPSGEVVRLPDGTVTVETRRRPVAQSETRCR